MNNFNLLILKKKKNKFSKRRWFSGTLHRTTGLGAQISCLSKVMYRLKLTYNCYINFYRLITNFNLLILEKKNKFSKRHWFTGTLHKKTGLGAQISSLSKVMYRLKLTYNCYNNFYQLITNFNSLIVKKKREHIFQKTLICGTNRVLEIFKGPTFNRRLFYTHLDCIFKIILTESQKPPQSMNFIYMGPCIVNRI